jgi:hypothetical protein
MVEMLDDHAVDAVQPQCLELVTQHRNARRRAGRIEEFAGVRLERHHAHRQAACVGGRAHAREQRLVAAMHAVEVADRQRARRAAFGVRKTPEDSHDGWPVGSRRFNGSISRPPPARCRKARNYKRSQAAPAAPMRRAGGSGKRG